MTNWLAGMEITADRLNDHTLEDSTTSGLVAATGFSINSFSGRKVNGITTVMVYMNRTGATIGETAAGTGNTTDTDMCTLPTGWTPPETMTFVWDNGANGGTGTVLTSGLMTIKTTTGSTGMVSGTNPRVVISWISENG